ncbi:prolyl-tRNA synthetase [Candidatus Saccharibacteria bacterium]|nr:prolyl-tRNA synthetase [Candidatus Saccharibacteria bacterium]MBP9489457.1 prolyl-tRNA synthetase [Candidatus Saccharibacteria bacterium]MBP9552326.1 prolyl-tRNA synthetase [Candidatus Saccharibacteria bacterium]
MRLSKVFTKTSKNIPSGEEAKNAQLLIRAGFINKEMAGVYDFLPLGKIVLDKIVQVIREEMNSVGGNEVSLSALQNPETWQASGRWSDDVMDVWFKTKLSNGREFGLAPTHEEPITKMMKNFISSYKDLPVYPYQFQTKFRAELRSKSGLMRGREFLMKDLYSFSKDETEHNKFYEEISEAYLRVFERLGLGDLTYKTFASGGSFSKYSHEFQTISPVGEDIIYISDEKGIAINEEVFNDEVLADLGINKEELRAEKAVEVGNIFTLGYKFSDALDLKYTAEDGKQNLVFMGSYGIGPSRLMGLLAEHFSDEKGLVWPENVAPAKVYLVQIGGASQQKAEEIYQQLTDKGIDVLFDDRDERPGKKFADAELMGIPYRLTVSDRLLESEKFELVSRATNETQMLSQSEILEKFI